MDNQQAILWLQMLKGIVLISKAEPDMDDNSRELADNTNEAIDMAINALTIMDYIGKEGNDGKDE